jgi:hypothetical protein
MEKITQNRRGWLGFNRRKTQSPINLIYYNKQTRMSAVVVLLQKHILNTLQEGRVFENTLLIILNQKEIRNAKECNT